jgi:hypothetical protein
MQHLHDSRVLELVQPEWSPIRQIYLIYGSLFPLETDIFAFYIVTPSIQNDSIASVRSLTGVLYSEAIDVWETRLGQFLTSDLVEVLQLDEEVV